MDDYKFIVLYEARWITFETGRVVPRHCRDFKGVQWTNICSNPDDEEFELVYGFMELYGNP